MQVGDLLKFHSFQGQSLSGTVTFLEVNMGVSLEETTPTLFSAPHCFQLYFPIKILSSLESLVLKGSFEGGKDSVFLLLPPFGMAFPLSLTR